MLATYVRDEDLNLEMVSIGDPEDHLLVQRALSFDDQDRALGQDTYCLVTATGATFYGGVEIARIESLDLVLSFTSEAVAALDLPVDLSATCEGPQADEALDHLARILS